MQIFFIVFFNGILTEMWIGVPDDVLSGTDKLHPRWTTYFPCDYGSIGHNNGHSKNKHRRD